jgi:hypothetical protein
MVLQHYLPIRCLLATAVLASLLVGPVARAESPQLLPTRDVDITYDVTLPSQPRVRERVRWLASEQLERVDGPHKSTTIFNRRTREIIHLSWQTVLFANWICRESRRSQRRRSHSSAAMSQSLRDCIASAGRGPKTWKPALFA